MTHKKRRIILSYLTFALRKYRPLINQLAFQIGVDPIHVRELSSRAKAELLRCMICYDRRKGSSFMTFLYGRLMGTFKHMRDAENRGRRIRVVPLDLLITVPSPEHDMDCNMMAQECLDCLNNYERQVIIGLFFDGKTIREMSHAYGTVPSTISRIKAQALDKMRTKCQVELK